MACPSEDLVGYAIQSSATDKQPIAQLDMAP